MIVLDLCAAPGGWSQIAAERVDLVRLRIETDRVGVTACLARFNALSNFSTVEVTDSSLLLSRVLGLVRDMVLGTGMVGGMEASYARLEEEVLGADVRACPDHRRRLVIVSAS